MNTSLMVKNLINGTVKDLGEQSFIIKGMIEEGDSAAAIIDISNSLKVNLIVLVSKGQIELG